MQKLRVVAKKWFQIRKSDWFYFIIVDGSKKHRKKDGYDARISLDNPSIIISASPITASELLLLSMNCY